MKHIVTILLGWCVRLVVWRTRPTIIAITGSVGKTTTKEAVAHLLRAHFGADRIVATAGNYNTEIGVPLTVIGVTAPGRNIFCWVWVFCVALWRMIVGMRADIVVLEFGADRPGDIDALVRMAPPTIGVITAVGDLPVHVEFYDTPPEVAAEKEKIVAALPSTGVAVLNRDEERVWDMRRRTTARRIVGVGGSDQADLRVHALQWDREALFAEDHPSVSLKIETEHHSVPLRLYHVLTRGQVQAAAMALAVGSAINVPVLEGMESLAQWVPPAGRFRPVSGVRGSVVIDDSYNASPLSTKMALQALGRFAGHRRIAVLGEMRELGSYQEQAHRDIGRVAAQEADIIIAVGRLGHVIESGATEAGMRDGAVTVVHTAEQAADRAYELAQEGDIILVKASRSIGLDKVVDTLSTKGES